MSDFANKPTKHVSEPLQAVIQLNVYRQVGDHFEYLLLKRIDVDSKFWQVVTEPLHSSSTIGDTLRQAASEQIGLRGFKHLSHETYSYEWYTHGERGRDIVFAAEVSLAAVITPDRNRFDDFAWMTLQDAVHHLKWDGNRTALKKLDAHLMETIQPSDAPLSQNVDQYQEQRHQVPEYPVMPLRTPGPGMLGGEGSASNPTISPPSRGPYGSNVPKRLPDQPSAVAASPVKEINPGELFL